ncbi:sphingosine-1-phosphate transporter MFSD2B isoform 6-T6 [Liasis olivaceus]
MAGVGTSDPPRGQEGLPPSPPSQVTGQPSPFQEPEQALGGTAEGLAHEDQLSVCSKLCYGIGGAPNQVASSATSFFLQIYLLDIAQVVGLHTIHDCVLYLAVVLTSLRIKPNSVVSGCLLPFPSPEYNQADRDSATAFRMAFEVLGTLIGATLQGQIVAGAHTSHCFSQNETIELQQNSSEVLDVSYGRKVYMIAAGLVGGIYLVGILSLFFGVKEKVDPYTLMPAKKVPFFKGQKHAMTHRPYLIFTAAFLLILTGIQIEQGNFVLFCTYAAGLRNHFQNLVLIILVSATASVPFWQRFLKRFGKKKAACGISLMIPSVIMLVTIPNLYLAYFVAFASGLSIAASFLLPWSMLPDVVDHFQLQNPHLPGHETIFYSSFIFFTKMSTGIGMGISSFSLQFVGYKSGMCTQSIHVVITLKILVGGIPSILILLGLSVLLLYPVNEKSQKEMKHTFENSRRIHSSTENFAEENTFVGKPEQK